MAFLKKKKTTTQQKTLKKQTNKKPQVPRLMLFIQISQAASMPNYITTNLTKFTHAGFWKVIKMLQNLSDYHGFV